MKDFVLYWLGRWVDFIENTTFWYRGFGIACFFSGLLAAGFLFAKCLFVVVPIVAGWLPDWSHGLIIFGIALLGFSFALAWCFENKD